MVYKPTNTTGGRASMAMVPGPPGQPGGPMFGGHQALFWGMNGQEHTQIYIYIWFNHTIIYDVYVYVYVYIYIHMNLNDIISINQPCKNGDVGSAVFPN